jgi:membrane protein YqaA with SNARE-associated domain
MSKNKTLGFRENRMFSYGRLNKIAFGLFVIFLGLILALLIITYFFQRDSDILIFKTINTIITHVSSHIWGSTPLGIIYTTLIGGIFFVTIPLEVLFIKFLKAGHFFLIVILFYLFGLLVSFTLNYYTGLKLSGLSKKIISPKKFYKTKGVLNRYGALAVFAFNALPLPAQPLSVILGVFRYNKTRFYIFFLTGQLVKYIIISIFINFF